MSGRPAPACSWSSARASVHGMNRTMPPGLAAGHARTASAREATCPLTRRADIAGKTESARAAAQSVLGLGDRTRAIDILIASDDQKQRDRRQRADGD